MYMSPEENLKICDGCGEIYEGNAAFEILRAKDLGTKRCCLRGGAYAAHS
jgi:hypothetical protein